MPIRLAHLVDTATHEDAARLLSLLLGRLPAEIAQHVLLMGPAPQGLTMGPQVSRTQVGRLFNWPAVSAISVRRSMQHVGADVALAWSAAAGATLKLVWRDASPTAAVLCDPQEAVEASRWWRSLSGDDRAMDIICTAGHVQRRVIESGTPIEATAVIRPGVDFGALRRVRRDDIRARLGIDPAARVLLTSSPSTRTGGQFQAVWAAAILHYVWPDATMIVPGCSREQQRLRRLGQAIYCPQIYRFTEQAFSPAELLVASDVFVLPARGDVPTGWLAWAMAAGVTIVASAVPAVAELIADRHNGFLCKSPEPQPLAVRIREAIADTALARRCAETARQQAYEVFRAERCVDEFLRVIRNLAGGQRAAVGIMDAAIDS